MITVTLGDKAFYIPDAALGEIEQIFAKLAQNAATMADWETMKIVPNNPARPPWPEGDYIPTDNLDPEGKD